MINKDNQKRGDNSCSLYLVSPPHFSILEFCEILKKTCDAGEISAFQLRMKNPQYPTSDKAANDDEILNAAEKIMPICHQYNIAFIINDNPEIAKKIGADGLHLGQEDTSIKQARKIIGEEIAIGVSCHASKDLAAKAGEEGADYVAFGAFHHTSSKPPEKQEKWGKPDNEILEFWRLNSILPSVAIGGMTPKNCVEQIRAGADFIAAITYVWNHLESPAKAIAEFNQAINSA